MKKLGERRKSTMQKIEYRSSLVVLLLVVLFAGCATKQPEVSKPAIILFKTKNMNFYDQGFINYYENNIILQIFKVGHPVLELKVSPGMVCRTTFECMSGKAFNKKFLHESYVGDFLYRLLKKRNIYHKDSKNKIFIKVKYVK